MEANRLTHKAGFVNIVGNTNVGKSTLLCELVGEKLSIISPKVQTTRHRILGIVNGEEYQIVYSDTPGILKPNYQLHESMLKTVGIAIEDADILLYMTDVVEKFDKNSNYISKINNSHIPLILLINKIDMATPAQVESLKKECSKIIPRAEIIPVSARKKINIDILQHRILELLPLSPAYFPKDEMTDRTERFIVSEIIREKIFLNYEQEIPYSVEVSVESFSETEPLIRIHTIIYVMKDSQKGIMIGNKGLSLKKIGIEARKDIETFFGKKVFLELFVKIRKNWRNDSFELKKFGYL